MSNPCPPPPVLTDAERCGATTDAGIMDAVLTCSLRVGHDLGPDSTEHEAWALPDGETYVGRAQLLASWP